MLRVSPAGETAAATAGHLSSFLNAGYYIIVASWSITMVIGLWLTLVNKAS